MFQQLQGQVCIEEGDNKTKSHLQDGLLYKLDKLYVPQGEILQLIIEGHTSKVAGHFGDGKTIANLKRYVYWTRMKEDVAHFFRGCIVYQQTT